MNQNSRKLQLTVNDLDTIKSAAKDLFLASSNTEIEASLYPTACTVVAFAHFLNKQGIELTVELPTRAVHQSVDDL
jgi:hypothetical protein